MPQAHGVIQQYDGASRILITRSVAVAPESLWAAFTQAEALAQWIGILHTDEFTGEHSFSMVEGEQAAEPKPVEISRCRAPHELEFSTAKHGGWDMGLRIRPDTDATGCVLEFHQVLRPEDDPQAMGPGWEYYMQRAIAVGMGESPDSVLWNDYYPGLADAYAPAPEKP